MTTIKIKTIKRQLVNGQAVFVGAVAIYENGKYLWAETSQIKRLTRRDARQDANNMYESLVLNHAYAN